MRNSYRIVLVVAGLALAMAVGACGKDKTIPMVMDNPPEVAPQPTTQAIPPGRVVAAGLLQVGERFVTSEMILFKGRDAFERLATEPDEAAFRRKALPVVRVQIQEAIRESLVLTEADRELREEDKKLIEANVKYQRQKMVTDAGGSEELLLHDLARDGRLLEDILEDYRRRLTIERHLHRKLVPELEIDKRMLWNHYVAYRKHYVFGKKVIMRVIAIPFSAVEGGKARASEMAATTAAEIKGGKNFAEVARELAKTITSAYGDKWDLMPVYGKAYVTLMGANGGLNREIAPESIADDALAAVAAKLDKGKTSDVVVAERCCYLVHMEDVRPAQDISFAEAQTDIERMISIQQMNSLHEKYLSQLQSRFRSLQGPQGEAAMEQLAGIVIDLAVDRYWRKDK